MKQDFAKQAQNFWEKCFALVDLKCRFLTLGTKEDKEPLHDKEWAPKQPKVNPAFVQLPGLCIRTSSGDMALPSEIAIWLKDYIAAIQSYIECKLPRWTDRDFHWEDQIDVGLQYPEVHSFILTCDCRMSISATWLHTHPTSSSIFIPLSLSVSLHMDKWEETPTLIHICHAHSGCWFIHKCPPPSCSTPDICSMFFFQH